VEIGTTDMSKLYFIKALLDCEATKSLIDRDFVCSKGMNTQTLLHNILVFNVNGSSNKTRQISKVVDVVFCYKTHSKRILLAVSGLGKQNLILGYDWLKDHNPKIDWEKEEVKITHCPLYCEEECILCVRATRAQDFRRILSYITVCGYDITHLQENPQRLG